LGKTSQNMGDVPWDGVPSVPPCSPPFSGRSLVLPTRKEALSPSDPWGWDPHGLPAHGLGQLQVSNLLPREEAMDEGEDG